MPFLSAKSIIDSGPGLLKLQNVILEKIARGDSLKSTMDRLCAEVELLVPNALCSVLSIDAGRLIHPLAGPSLPDSYSQALDGIAIGPAVGSCGTAAHLGVAVAVTDIETDPRWVPFKHLALAHGLRACWSTPIVNSKGVTVATFAFYYSECRGPTTFEEDVVSHCARLCFVAIDRHQRVIDQETRAFTDALTGLPNRAAFNAELAKLDCRAPGSWAIFVLDLDNLKTINDTFGHLAGDRLLEVASQRIAEAMHFASVFRIGGDEFAIVLRSPEALRDLDQTAETILNALAIPTQCGGNIMIPRATIGGAVLSHNELVADRVRQNADFALYHAKETRRGRFVRYWPGLGSTMTRRLDAIRDVGAALGDDRIYAYYQPIFRLDSKEIVGLEALCRMRIGDKIMSAESFFEATTDAHVATALTARMMAIVAADVRSWLELGIPFQHVGINVSSADLSGGMVENVMTAAFEKEGVPMKHVILEVTEAVYMGGDNRLVDTAIAALRAKGIRIALDDFGTGFASLTHLLSVPVDIIKIDKSFIDNISTDNVSMVIVESLIRIAQKMGSRVVAEGVETEEQASLLHSAGCVLAQGYLCSKAVDRHQTTALLLDRAQYGTKLPQSQSAAILGR